MSTSGHYAMTPRRERLVLAWIALATLACVASVTGWIAHSVVMCR